MGEKLRPNPEKMAEFWDGHHFEDGCPVETPVPATLQDRVGCLLILPFVVPILIETNIEDRERQRVFNELRKYIAMPKEVPIKRLGKEEEFKIEDYPKDTVLRYMRHSQSLDVRQRSEIFWGMVSQRRQNGKLNDVVFAYRQNQLIEGRYHPMSGLGFSWDVILGQTEHTKAKESRFSSFQYLTRIDWLEVWKYGTAVREREKEPIISRILHPASKSV